MRSCRLRSLRALVISALCPLVLAVSCRPTPDAAAPTGVDARSAEVFAALQVRLDKRLGSIRDFTLEGTARTTASQETVNFTYTFAQPRYARATIGADQSIVFDGTVLVAMDHRVRQAARVDVSSGEERLLLALHQAFSDFACEGWRPPLVRPSGTRAHASTGPQGDRVELIVPIDDADLREERLLLRADGSFLEKKTIDRAGEAVAWTRVLEELSDPATGLLFPRRWERGSRDARVEVTITKAVVNAGVSPGSFSTEIPAGYTTQTAAPPPAAPPPGAEAPTAPPTPNQAPAPLRSGQTPG